MTRLDTIAAHILAALLPLRSQNATPEELAGEALTKARALVVALDAAQPPQPS